MEVFAYAEADASRPQEMSRRLGLDKSLAWKLSRVVQASDTLEALKHMPGEAAFEILIKALDKAGVQHDSIKRARQSVEAFWKTVRTEVGDRPTLELVLDAMPSSDSTRLAVSRKLAFRGNSGIWGIQARVRVNTLMLAPSPEDPTLIDSVLVGGWVDLRRLRGDASWVLFRRRSYTNSTVVTEGEVNLDARGGAEALLVDYCSDPLPPIHTTSEDGVTLYELGPSPIGNSGQFSLFFGTISRKLGSRFASQPGETADFSATISAPVETLLFDMIVHRDCAFATNPRFSVYSQITPGVADRKPRDLLPITGERHSLGGLPPVLATPLVPSYANLMDDVFARLKWNSGDFFASRYIMEYPPFPSTVIASVDLEER